MRVTGLVPRLHDLVEAPLKTRLGDLQYLLLTLRIARRLRRMPSPRVRGAAVKVMVVAVVSGLVLASCTNDTSTAEPQVSDTPVAALPSTPTPSPTSTPTPVRILPSMSIGGGVRYLAVVLIGCCWMPLCRLW